MKRDLPTAHYLNRELGILAFNRRVLAQAADDTVPLLERLGFLTIVSSNLDEFFEIRVAGLKEQIKLNLPEPGPDGKGPQEVFEAVSAEARAIVAEQYRLLNDVVLPALAGVAMQVAAMNAPIANFFISVSSNCAEPRLGAAVRTDHLRMRLSTWRGIRLPYGTEHPL